jgi:hypothetical protein
MLGDRNLLSLDASLAIPMHVLSLRSILTPAARAVRPPPGRLDRPGRSDRPQAV